MTTRRAVLIIGNYPPPYGGVPRHIEDLVPYLVQCGWDVHVMSFGKTGTERHNGFAVYKDNRSRMQRQCDLTFLYLSAFIRGRFRCLRQIQNWFSGSAKRVLVDEIAFGNRIVILKRASVVLAYNLMIGAPVGHAVSELNRIPLIVTNFGEIHSHRSFFDDHFALVQDIVKKAASLVSMTRHCAASYGLIGLTPKVKPIPIGVDVDRFNPRHDGSSIRMSLGLLPEHKVVLFVGRINSDMGIHVLARAVPFILRNPETRVVVVGPKWADHALNLILDLAREYPDRVLIRQDVPIDDMPFFYAACDVLVAPTQGERACGSLAAAEAMASGKPVVGSRVGGIPEFVSEGVTGFLFPPEDSEALATSVLKLLDDESLAGEMGRHGRERAVSYLNKDETNRRYEELLSQMLQ